MDVRPTRVLQILPSSTRQTRHSKESVQGNGSYWPLPKDLVSLIIASTHRTKKDGTLRPCGDYRRLNMLMEPDDYPRPNIADTTIYLHGVKILLRLDLLKGYCQVPMNPDDIPKTAITTPFGTYTFNYSCFGLRNAFQWMMDNVPGDLPFCITYSTSTIFLYFLLLQTNTGAIFIKYSIAYALLVSSFAKTNASSGPRLWNS